MIKKPLFLALMILGMCGVSFTAYANKEGEKAFKANCKACHATDRFSTGPSLVYIRDTYPLSERQAFLNWSKEPGKKNPDTIQMPPMGHVGEETLVNIHDYILLVSKRVKERQSKPKFKHFRNPKKAFPYVKRSYLPFTSPASIQVVLNADVTVVWDSTIGKVRYVYPTGNPFNGEQRLEENKQDVLYTETASHGFSFGKNKPVVFKGYDLVEGSPEFIYQIGDIKIREKIAQGQKAKSFVRSYVLTGVSDAISFDLSYMSNAENLATIKVNKGTITDGVLLLSATQAAQFSIEVTL